MTLSGVAQNSRVIKGKVLDIDGQSIAGATLRVMGSNEEIRSAEDGSFTFNVSPYAKELEAASLIEGNEETLFQALMYEYSDNWKIQRTTSIRNAK